MRLCFGHRVAECPASPGRVVPAKQGPLFHFRAIGQHADTPFPLGGLLDPQLAADFHAVDRCWIGQAYSGRRRRLRRGLRARGECQCGQYGGRGSKCFAHEVTVPEGGRIGPGALTAGRVFSGLLQSAVVPQHGIIFENGKCYLMSYILQVDFPYAGPWGQAMVETMEGLAHSIAEEPGLIWKIWTENEAAAEAGGIYLFRDRPSAEAYLTMHTERLKGFGIPRVNGKIFAVNTVLSRIDRGPV